MGVWSMPGPVPAGWYPQQDGTQRYWDGAQWTDYERPATPPPSGMQTAFRDESRATAEPLFNRDDPRWDQPEFGEEGPPAAPSLGEQSVLPERQPFYKQKWMIIPAILIIGLCAALVFVRPGATDQAVSPEPTQSASDTAAPTEPVRTVDPTGSAAGDYAVTIDGAHFTEDNEGAKAIVVDFTFKNGSAEATSFLLAIERKAFQNGVELANPAMVTDDANYDIGSPMKEVKPGATQTPVQWSWTLDDASDVTIEVSELFAQDGTLIASKVFRVS